MQSNALFCFKTGPRSVSFAPFLYQTRTLAPLFCQQANQRRASHQSSEAGEVESQPPSFKISRVDPIYGQSSEDYADEVASYPSASQWRQTHPSPSYRPRNFDQFDEPSPKLPRSNIDQYEPVPELVEEVDDTRNDFEDSDVEEYDLDSYRPGAPSKESTITESEKTAFNRIFSDIFKKLKVTGERVGSMARNYSPLVSEKDEARATTAELMDQAVRDLANEGRRRPVSFKPWDTMGEPGDVEKKMRIEIEKYPPSLRPAASRALASVARRDILDSGIPHSEPQEQLAEAKRLEYIREPERKRVEQLMRAAKTDFELWQVLEDEVFSIVSKLGLRYGEDKKSRKATQSSDTTLDMSQLEVLGPLYPSYLLLGIRFLSTAFSKPSPLALSILPHIKSLGIISHVLGASTALYNEILRIQWLQYGNYTAVLDMLSEMENSGLDFDRETLDIVQGIQRMRDRVNEGERGEVVKALFAARFAPISKLFAGWERKISAEVIERGKEFERRLMWTK